MVFSAAAAVYWLAAADHVKAANIFKASPSLQQQQQQQRVLQQQLLFVLLLLLAGLLLPIT